MKYYKCSFCKAKFSELDSCLAHAEKHKKSKKKKKVDAPKTHNLSHVESNEKNNSPSGKKKVTVVKVQVGRISTEASSLMNSEKVDGDLVHYMCIICESKFRGEDEATTHVTTKHGTAHARMCPILRCTGRIGKQTSSYTQHSEKTYLLPSLERIDSHLQKLMTPQGKRRGRPSKTNVHLAQGSKFIPNRKSGAKNEVIVVWNADKPSQEQQGIVNHAGSGGDGPTYMCYSCQAEFGSYGLCRLHMRTRHRNIKTKPEEEEFPQAAEMGTSISQKDARTSESDGTQNPILKYVAEGSKSTCSDVHVRKPTIDDLLNLSKCILALSECEDKTRAKTSKDLNDSIGSSSRYMAEDSDDRKGHFDTDHYMEDDLEDELDSLVSEDGSAGNDSKFAGSVSGESVTTEQETIRMKYPCSLCPKKFSSSRKCGNHMKRVHPGSNKRSAKNGVKQGVSLASADDQQQKPEKSDQVQGKRKSIKKHKKSKKKKKKSVNPCTECDMIFSHKTVLNNHIGRKHCGTSKLKCRACAKFSKDLGKDEYQELVEEVKKMNGKMQNGRKRSDNPHKHHFYECVMCGEAFKIEYHFRKHRSHHPENICPLCNMSFSSSKALYTHISFHNCGPLKCWLCSQTFYSTRALLHHSLGHADKFTCDLCQKSFVNAGNLKRHQSVTHAKEETSYKCESCTSAFRYQHELNTHIKQVHKNRKKATEVKFICHVCGDTYKNARDLRMHLPYHDEVFTCEQCGCWFREESQLSLHKSRVHEGSIGMPIKRVPGKPQPGKFQKPLKTRKTHPKGKNPRQFLFKCRKCSLSFQTFSALQEHKYHEHEEIQHKCDICGKGFAKAQTLKLHKKVHVVLPSECFICGRTYRRPDLLEKHISNVHCSPLFGCTLCKKRFHTADDLEMHRAEAHQDKSQQTTSSPATVLDDSAALLEETAQKPILDGSELVLAGPSEEDHSDIENVMTMEEIELFINATGADSKE